MNTTFNSDLSEISNDIIKTAFQIRNQYGRLMMEKFYEKVMEIELTQLGYHIECQVPITLNHKGITIPNCFRADMIVEDKIILEFKAIPYLSFDEFRQLITYLKLTDKRVGYLINFGAKDFTFGKLSKDGKYPSHGLYRLVN